MASLEGDEVISGENGNVTRRTRSGRAVKPSTVSPTKPGPKSRKAALNKPVFENTEDLKEMAKGLDAMFEQEEEQDEEGGDPEEGFVLPLGCERSPKSDSTANPTLGVGYGEESNGSMDAMLNTCFQENIISNDEDVEMPFESMDGSIADAATEAEGIPLDDSEFFIKCDSQVEAVEEEVMEEPKIQQEVNEEVQQEAKEEVEQEVKETVPEKKEVIEVAKKTEDDIGAEDISDSHVSASENEGMEGETEVVSEDELPVVEKPEVKDAENVSDDELPGPKPAELPADTEVVSEDELPSSKKESARESRKRKTKSDSTGYDPGSPTSENEGSTKKQAIAKDGESKPQPAEKRVSEEQTTKKKVLPELDKYWKAVNDEPTDFTAWTYLLQYVDQESDVEAAREAYDAFLSHYPYCYGYWRKYADYEKRKGSKKKCLEVLERGLRGVPMSVDLWIHFLNHAKTTRSEDQQYIRQQYERAVAACGLEFRSDRLWESYIKWETENGTPLQVTALYDRLLATPTLGYTTHFDNFQEHIMSHPAHLTVPVASFVQHRADVRSSSTKGSPLPDSDPDIPPGEEEADDHVRSEEEASSIKEKVIAVRRKIHKITIDQVAQRWNFEEGIKRPYFHVKPLERCQLKNWKAYLEWEEQRDDPTRTLVLYERCLIACALYEEFWLRLVQYLEGRIASLESEPDTEEERGRLTSRTRDVLERACTIHHLDKPALHLRWAFFEEAQGNACRACEILERLDKTCPNLLQVAYRRINLERRRGDFDKCSQLYESYISSTKSKMGASNMAVKFARFLLRWRSDLAGAIKVLRAAISKDPACQRLYLQMVDVALAGKEVDVTQVVGYLDEYLSVESIDSDSRLLFSQRKLELLEELSDRVQDIQAAQLQYQRLAKQHHKKKNKDKALPMGDPKKKDGNIPPLPANNAVSGAVTSGGAQGGYGGYGNTGAYSYGAPPPTQQPPYEAGAAAGYPPQPYQAPWGQYQQPPNPYQQHTWPPYQNYY